jgi:hypothetical protein
MLSSATIFVNRHSKLTQRTLHDYPNRSARSCNHIILGDDFGIGADALRDTDARAVEPEHTDGTRESSKTSWRIYWLREPKRPARDRSSAASCVAVDCRKGVRGDRGCSSCRPHAAWLRDARDRRARQNGRARRRDWRRLWRRDGRKRGAAQSGVLHAWIAGPQTTALRRQLETMPDGGVYVMSIPRMPIRCPAAPYERACQVAWYFQRTKPRSRIIILDANEDVASMGPLFKAAWSELYGGIVEYQASSEVVGVDALRYRIDLPLQQRLHRGGRRESELGLH